MVELVEMTTQTSFFQSFIRIGLAVLEEIEINVNDTDDGQWK